MNGYAHLFYGLGQVAYAVALSDGLVQSAEQEKLHQIVLDNLEQHNLEYDYAEIIFGVLKKDEILNSEQAFEEGIKNINLGGNYLTLTLKNIFIDVICQVAESFPPTTSEEQLVVEQFKIELTKIK